MKIPSLPFAPTDFRRYPEGSQLVRHAEAPTPEDIAELHAIVRTGLFKEVETALGNAGLVCDGPSIAVQFMAVEPTTGNSLMHTALIAQRTDLIDLLRRFRTHNAAPYYKLFYALHSHQRHDGDTMLHSAVRTGKLEVLKAAMQVFRHGFIDAADERFRLSERQGGRSWYNSSAESTNSMRIGELVFLLKCNEKGQTAASLARTLGYTDMAAWLEKSLQLDDPQGQREDASAVQLWRESCDEYCGLP